MNLNDLIKLTKKTQFFLAGTLVLFLIGVAVYVYLDNPSGEHGFGKLAKPEVKTILAKEANLKSSLRGSTKIPRLANVYSFKEKNNFNALVAKLNFSGAGAKDKSKLIWKKPGEQLNIDTVLQTFEYTASNPTGVKKVNESQAYSKAEEFLKNLGLLSAEVELQKLKTNYLGGAFELQELLNETGAEFYVFYIGATLEELPLVKPDGSKTLFSVWVGIDGSVQEVSGGTRKLAFQEKSTYPVKHLSTVKKNVKEGEEKVTSSTLTFNPKVTKDFVVEFQNNELVYYLDSQKDFLQPVFRLSTEGFYSSSKITALLEALKDQSYK